MFKLVIIMVLMKRPFKDIIEMLPATNCAKAYIENLFDSQIDHPIDLSQASIILTLHETNAIDLKKFQMIGDWVLWVNSFFPAHIADYEPAVSEAGRMSYCRCYRLVPSWSVYEELAENMLPITRCINDNLTPSSI